jgi:hypothetical protein
MNSFIERAQANWRAVGLLAVAAATLPACAVATLDPISPKATSPIEMRSLSPIEKAALAKVLAQRLKDPSAAQFRWLPVAANGSGPIGYCGVVNFSSGNGKYLGFRRFFAMISKGPKGEYVDGRIEHIDAIPVVFGGSSTEQDAGETGLTEDNCKNWGYTDFSGAT